MSFRDEITDEAAVQRELRRRGEPIPRERRKYARLAGLGITLVCGGGAVVVFVLGLLFGTLYWVVALFFLVLAGLGALQLLSGRHLLTGRE
ncbi:MAG: hypothetical protein J0L92_23620 [Deltaproteobacteria bacterium]|nr:hypothetical protein [Deltaproteobacteria bacterium]